MSITGWRYIPVKPIDKLGPLPPPYVVFHELGHAFVAKHLGLMCQIECTPSATTGACAITYWSSQASASQRVASCLAGAYAQALYRPRTVGREVRPSILNGTLFDDGLIFSGQSLPQTFFFDRDLTCIRNILGDDSPPFERSLRICREAYAHLYAIFKSPQRERFFSLALRDIRKTDDSDVEALSPLTFYHDERLTDIYSSCPHLSEALSSDLHDRMPS